MSQTETDQDQEQSPTAGLRAPKLLGASVAFLGGTVLISWYLYTLELVTLPTMWVPMQYNSAIGFVLTGLAVVAHCVGRRRTALTFGALAAGLGSVALAEQALGRQFEIISQLVGRDTNGEAPALMAPNTAVCFSLAGGLILVASFRGTSQRWRNTAMGVMASLLAAAGFVGLLSFVLNNDMAQGWARFTEMDVHTGLAFVGLGVAFFGMVGHFRTQSINRRLPPWAAWAAGGGVGLLIVGIWVGLTSSEDRLRVMATTRTHEAALTHANQLMQSHLRTLERLSRLFEADGGRSPETLARDVEIFVGDTPGLVGLVQVDTAGEVEFIRGPGAAGDEWAQTIVDSPVVKQLVTDVERSGGVATSDPYPLRGEVDAFFVAVPITDADADTADGFLLVEHAVQPFFDFVFADGVGRSFNVELSTENGLVFYRSYDAYTTPRRHVSSMRSAEEATGRLAFGSQIWGLQGAADPYWMTGRRSASNTLILWVGMFLAASITFAVRKSELLGQRAASLESANRTIADRSDSLRAANESLEEQARNLRATEERLRRTAREKRRVLDSLSAFLVGVDSEGVVTEWNFVSSELFGLRSSETLGRRFDSLNLPWDPEAIKVSVQECHESGNRIRRDNVSVDFGAQDEARIVSFTINPTQEERGQGFSIIGADVTERRMLEMQLHHAQKLESVGTLAAGIAHEINTPMQFVSDNVRFLSQSVNPIIGVLQLVPGLIEESRNGTADEEMFRLVEEMLSDVDIDFVADEMPMAIDETLEGVERVTTIVRAMKDFSHPGSDGAASADINEAIETTLAVARNEYKYHADVVTDFGELDAVECWVADLNQVFLNLLVNGTHAIREKLGDNNSERGVIRIETRTDADMVEIRFSDTGTGIPEEVQAQIFDQFYTTKEVGRGTGLGLAIARAVIVEKHGGTLTFETEKGKGTTFIVRVPVKQQEAMEEVPSEAHPVC